jgi:hypothetical protein
MQAHVACIQQHTDFVLPSSRQVVATHAAHAFVQLGSWHSSNCDGISGTSDLSTLHRRTPRASHASLLLLLPPALRTSTTADPDTETLPYLLPPKVPATQSSNALQQQQQQPNPCTTNPCRYGGTCRRTGSSFTCQCLFGYSGQFCELINACLIRRPCLNGGICQSNAAGGYLCQCRDGYFGASCELRDVCRQWNPCRNGGQCVSTGGSGFYCRCQPQWQGPQCDLPVRRPGVINEFG